MTPNPHRDAYRFGVFEFSPRQGELRKHGIRVKLQDQPCQVLRLLLERAGDVVTRDEFCQRLWSAETFVDFDDGLNTAIRKLREALGDSTETPRFIETLPRRGYRFIAAAEAPSEQPAPPAETPSMTAGEQATRRRSRMAMSASVALCAFLLAGVGAWHLVGRYSALEAINSLAVLPLENLSGDSSQEYFADGITDALTTELARIGSLRVISRTSSMQYKGRRTPLPQIARELRVDALLDGSVVREGNRVRITARLIEGRTDRHLWAESYERDIRDILNLQNEIAVAVAERVHARLSALEQNRLGTSRVVNPDAYDQYLLGKFYSTSRTEMDVDMAIAALRRAVTLDPIMAAGHAELARLYTSKAFNFRPQEKQWEELALEAATRAIALDPELAEAYLARGVIYWTHHRGFPHERAIKEYRQALKLNPNLDEAHHQLGNVYMHIGLLDRSVTELSTAMALNPSNVGARYRTAVNLLMQGKHEQGAATLDGTRGFNPSLWTYQMAFALFQLGRKEQAAFLIEDYLRKNPVDEGGVANGMQALLHADAGNAALAEKSIQMAIESGKGFGHFHHTAYIIGATYAVMNSSREAVKWLRIAAADGFPCYPLYERDANLRTIRRDPAFLEFMEELRKDWTNRQATQ